MEAPLNLENFISTNTIFKRYTLTSVKIGTPGSQVRDKNNLVLRHALHDEDRMPALPFRVMKAQWWCEWVMGSSLCNKCPFPVLLIYYIFGFCIDPDRQPTETVARCPRGNMIILIVVMSLLCILVTSCIVITVMDSRHGCQPQPARRPTTGAMQAWTQSKLSWRRRRKPTASNLNLRVV